MTWNGWKGGWPIQWGGGPTAIESTHDALVDSVGKGHAADVDGIEWRWREARAIGLGILSTYSDRARAQHDPRTATDGLPFYREVFRIPDSTSDQLAREAANFLYHTKPKADVPSIDAELKRIDPRLSILERSWAASITTVQGRAFEDFAKTKPFNFLSGVGETKYPNFSHAFEYVVLFDITSAPTGTADQAVISLVKEYLDEALSAWVSYSIIGSAGFILDLSPLDWTGFEP